MTCEPSAVASSSRVRSLPPLLLGVVAGCGYGVYLFLARRGTRGETAKFTQPLAWATGSATLTTTLLSPFTGGLHLDEISARSWALLGVLAVLGQVVAWLLIHHGSANLTPSATSGVLLTQPLIALALSAAILAEHPTPLQMVGAGVVLLSVAIGNDVLTAAQRAARPTTRGRSRP